MHFQVLNELPVVTEKYMAVINKVGLTTDNNKTMWEVKDKNNIKMSFKVKANTKNNIQ